MRFHHPILLLSLSIATTLTLLSTPTEAARDLRSASLPSNSQHGPQRQQQPHASLQRRRAGSKADATPIDGVKATVNSVPPVKYVKRRQRLSASTDTTTTKRTTSRKNVRKSKKSIPASTGRTSKSTKASKKGSKVQLKKRAPPAGSVKSRTAGPPAPIPNTPLLLLPDSRSVWQSGTYQTVKWSRKYSKSLPEDTTVDIILVNSKTNRKVYSLKRFIPFKKGSAQVLVPAKVPEDVSFVLVLELFRGRSQEQVTSTVLPSSPSTAYDQEQDQHQEQSPGALAQDNGGRSLSTVVRRSDISIATGSRKAAAAKQSEKTKAVENTDASRDVGQRDYYTGNREELPYGFLPNELREEYPSAVRPLVLEHTFGLHQKVYSMTPYTLEWKIPGRVAELLDYTRQVYMVANTWYKNSQQSSQTSSEFTPKSTFLAKVLVELVKDTTMETVSVLARDVPAETMFLYLSIQDRVPQAFYRLRVQMVVVQVQADIKTLVEESTGGFSGAAPGKQSKGMEGWEFPKGGEVIDRYEAVTRRFWVSQGAL
ncbi:hypothetical protein BGX31_010351 [Mortierella sp. GBA43]|nr:hypothetical protein BGX31_010351 [Mortierella sp. GBA43]